MERWLIIFVLPLEVWMDILCYQWISREEMGRIVDRIGNYKFAEYLQFYLHDWGKHQLKHLWIDRSGFYKIINYGPLYKNIPQAQMPDNINHFDARTIAFLRQIGPLLTNVNLNLNYCNTSSDNILANFRIVIANLLPLLNSGIHSLGFDLCLLPTVEQFFGDKFAQIKVLDINGRGFGEMDEAAVQAMANILLNWLISPGQDDNGPRCCKIVLPDVVQFEKISLAIREQFLSAKTPSTFALINCVCCLDHPAWRQYVEFHLQNTIGEELHGVQTEHGFFRTIQITRRQPNRDKELQEWIKEEANIRKNDAQIWITDPTIGAIDAMNPPVGEDEDQQPSTSKKARIS